MRIILTAIAAFTLAAPAAAQFSGQSQSPAQQPAPTTTEQAPTTGTAQPQQPASPTPMTENTDSSYTAVGIGQTDKVGTTTSDDGTP